MKVINFYCGETFQGKGLAVIGFSDGHDEVLEVYLQNQMVTFFKKRVYGSQHSISDVWTKHSIQAEYIKCEEWDYILATQNSEETIRTA